MELKKIFNISILSFLIALSVSSSAQTMKFYYREISPNPYLSVEKVDLKNYKNIIEYLPRNFVRDASVDYTEFLQKAIDENKNIIFPDFPILINNKGLKVYSNSNIFFNKHSALVMKPNGATKYSFFYLNEVNNINFFNLTLIGDRKKHLSNKGEWGMGIHISGSTNIKIYNVRIKDTWGDGIYISSSGNKHSKNVLIKNGHVDNVRRNGISIISGSNIFLDNILISNTNGTKPGAGIDIEPNKSTDILENIFVTNVTTFNNENEGILFVLTRIGNSKSNKKVSISIANHKDEGSNYAMRFGSGFRKMDKPLTGLISIINSEWLYNRNKDIIRVSGDLSKLPKVSFKNTRVKNSTSIDLNNYLKKRNKNNHPFEVK